MFRVSVKAKRHHDNSSSDSDASGKSVKYAKANSPPIDKESSQSEPVFWARDLLTRSTSTKARNHVQYLKVFPYLLEI